MNTVENSLTNLKLFILNQFLEHVKSFSNNIKLGENVEEISQSQFREQFNRIEFDLQSG